MKGLSSDIDAAISFKVNNGTKISVSFNRDTLIDDESSFSKLLEKEIIA